MRHFLIGFVVFLLGCTNPASADINVTLTNCTTYSNMMSIISEWNEKKTGFGIVYDRKHVVELYVNEQTGAWTLVITRNSSKSCVITFGVNWYVKYQTEIRG